MKIEGRLSKASVGEFNPNEWKSEGNSLLLSSRLLRARWLINRRHLLKRLKDHANFGRAGSIIQDRNLIDIDKSLSKSSILLIGYAVEMFLKAGLARALVGCGEDLFIHLSKKYSHNYLNLAFFLKYPVNNQVREDLEALSTAVKQDARYPISLSEGDDYFYQLNQQRKRQADNAKYKRYCALASDISAYASRLAGSQKNSLSHGTTKIDNDGYIAYRYGGSLPPIITFKLSSELKNELSPRYNLKQLAVGEIPFLKAIWDDAEVYEHVVVKNGVKHERRTNDSFMPTLTPQASEHRG